MNRKQFTFLIVLVVLVGGLGLVLFNRKAETWQTSDRAGTQKVIPNFPINDISQITLKHQTNELTLSKQDDVWKVKERYNYPANFTEISEFLRKVWELKPVQEVQVGPSQLSRLELGTPDKTTNSSTSVDFKDKAGKTLTSLLLGKKHMRESQGSSQFGGGGEWPDGRYVMAPQAQGRSKVWIISDSMSSIEPKPDQWLNKDFFKVEKLKTISIVSQIETNSWKLTRETESGDWTLADKKEGEELDKNKTFSVNNALSSPSFNDIASPDTKPEENGLDKPLVATLETFENLIYTVKVGGKTNDETFALAVSLQADVPSERPAVKDEKPEDKAKLDKEFKEKNDKLKEKVSKEKALEKWTYLVSKWTIDPLLKQRHDFLAEKKAEPKADGNTPDKETPPLPVPPEKPEPEKKDGSQ